MKHNLLFITTDQQRFDSIKAYGFDKAKTPNLDELCKEGVVFENYYVAAPVCVACRASMMTGLYPSVVGALGNESWIEDHIPTWPGIMSKAGYKTAGIGKMHFSPWDVLSGFQERIICEDKRHYYIPDDHAKYLEAKGLKRISPVQYPNYHESIGAPFYPYSKEFYPDVFIADRACEWLDNNGDEQFASWVSFVGPHDPYDPPRGYEDLYSIDDMPDPIPVSDYTADKTAYNIRNTQRDEKHNAVYQCDPMNATKQQMKYWRKNYMTNLSIIDEGIGKIFDMLKKKGLWENTTIIFTSDHGDALGDHGLVAKCHYYESMVHVPLIVKGPGVPVGERRSALVTTSDIVQYFFDALGVKGPRVVQGKSIKNLIDHPDAKNHEVVYSEMKGWYMTFDGRYKLSYYQDYPWELYDLLIDPEEMTNVAARPAYAEIRNKLAESLLGHMTDCNVQRTRLSNKVACEKRIAIDEAYKAGKNVFDL